MTTLVYSPDEQTRLDVFFKYMYDKTIPTLLKIKALYWHLWCKEETSWTLLHGLFPFHKRFFRVEKCYL